MGVGARAVYLKSYLLMNGIPVEGDTVSDVVENFDRIKRAVIVPPEVDEKVDTYRNMGGDRRSSEKINARLDTVRGLKGLRGYLLARHDHDIGPEATIKDARAVVETVGKKRGWRDRKDILEVIDRIEAAVRPSKVEKPPEEKTPEVTPREAFPVGDADPRPYYVRNFAFTFTRSFWTEPRPERAVSFTQDPFVMQDYGHITLQHGKSVFMGKLKPGEAVVAIVNPKTGIATAALMPMGHRGGVAMDAIREKEIRTVFVSHRAAGIKRHSLIKEAEARLDDIGNPYSYEFNRILREHAKIAADGFLKAAIIFAGGSDGEGMEEASSIAGAARAMGIGVVEIVSVSEDLLSRGGGEVVFDSGTGAVTVGGAEATSLGDSSETWGALHAEGLPFGDTVDATGTAPSKAPMVAQDSKSEHRPQGVKAGSGKKGLALPHGAKVLPQIQTTIKSLK